MAREHVRSLFLPDQFITTVFRPQLGWSDKSNPDSHKAEIVALECEKTEGETVVYCDIYWVRRSTAPSAFGLWRDYLLYNTNDVLIGFGRGFVD